MNFKQITLLLLILVVIVFTYQFRDSITGNSITEFKKTITVYMEPVTKEPKPTYFEMFSFDNSFEYWEDRENVDFFWLILQKKRMFF